MAKCEVCQEDMLEVGTCITIHYILRDGTKVTPTPVGYGNVDHAGPGERCGDCNAMYGMHHHPGCDNETCSICGLQYIGCDCPYSDDMEVIK